MAARRGRHYLASDISFRALHTTRSRLVEQAREPFAMFSSDPGNIHPENNTLSFSLESDQLTVNLVAPGMEIDYWEVDPAWNGQVFHSVAQVHRSNNSSSIPFKIKLPLAAVKICLRVVTVDGEQFQLD